MLPEPGSVIRIPLKDGSYALGLITHSAKKFILVRVNLKTRRRGEFNGKLPDFGKDWESFLVAEFPFVREEWNVVATEVAVPDHLKILPRYVMDEAELNVESRKMTFRPRSLNPMWADESNTAPVEVIICAGYIYIESHLHKKIPMPLNENLHRLTRRLSSLIGRHVK